jgi:hypothetical protein
MKNLSMSFTLCLVTFFFTSDLLAQNYWKGGTPGSQSNWNTAKNWSQNQVPDWSQDLIIPDVFALSGFFPVIDQVIEAFPYNEMQSNAVFTVLPHGRLVIDGTSTYNSGHFLNGKLIASGEIDIAKVASMDIEQRDGKMFLRKGVWAKY